MEYTGQSQKNTLIAVILIIGLIGMYNWFVRPQARYIAVAKEYQQTVDDMKKTSIAMSKKQKISRESLRDFLQQLNDQKQGLFTEKQAKEFLANLQSIAEQTGCMVLEVRHKPVKPVFLEDSNSIDIDRHEASMRLMGGYENIVGFLNLLQGRPTRVWIDKISLDMRSPTSTYLTCDAVLSIYTLDIKEIQSDVDSKK